MANEPSPSPPDPDAPWELRARRLDGRVWVDAQALSELCRLRQAHLHQAALARVNLKLEYLAEGLDYMIGLLEWAVKTEEEP